ncbi:MAG: phosphoglucosamine mutase [Gammaproteobacteria bacterium]|nr:phosphoglucosamine mutase [Gammaproteobacteria bacterium]
MTKKYFGTDGIRGKVGEEPITAEFVLKLGWAVGRVLAKDGGGKVLIGKDTRLSGYMFESALQAGLSAAGVDILLVGPMPTPAIAYLTRTLHAQAGIVISASHNPFDDNGFKFFSSFGNKLSDEIEFEIEAQLEKKFTTVDSALLGKAERVDDAGGRYIEFCKSTIPGLSDFKGLKIVVDAAHGATYHVAPSVFRELRAEVIEIGVEPNGLNINEKCGATNPALLQEWVVNTKSDLGVALDGDGDRVIMVDANGDIVDGDEILYIIAQARNDCAKHENGNQIGTVVGTHMSNLGLEHALTTQGIPFERVPVGDRHIMEMLIREGWVLGGESSGHIICLDRTTTGDGIVSALQVIAEMRKKGRCLHELKSGMSKYPQCLVNVKMKKRVDVMSSNTVQKAVKDAENQLADSGRVLLRLSGTEPLVRVMVEGKNEKQVYQVANELATVVSDAMQT